MENESEFVKARLSNYVRLINEGNKYAYKTLDERNDFGYEINEFIYTAKPKKFKRKRQYKIMPLTEYEKLQIIKRLDYGN
jgi:hypothetical protein